MEVKTQIKLTYNLKDAQGCGKQIDKAFDKIMKSIGAKWYAQGCETDTQKRDVCYDLYFTVKKENNER